eukprot:CAMPEP_0194490024 /NCGR_PEP_ID=MMETSP0253-20130528/9387_1 /TAXON_ID=2966 /ORGANISM="Noctiluca scintillans" /LENGTH=37 /DNA_ID= /DNA_START= /DNA_END= /DNA_ORIENTATION=
MRKGAPMTVFAMMKATASPKTDLRVRRPGNRCNTKLG